MTSVEHESRASIRGAGGIAKGRAPSVMVAVFLHLTMNDQRLGEVVCSSLPERLGSPAASEVLVQFGVQTMNGIISLSVTIQKFIPDALRLEDLFGRKMKEPQGVEGSTHDRCQRARVLLYMHTS